jgi:tetratricopeptide (TPR) repeat protein
MLASVQPACKKKNANANSANTNTAKQSLVPEGLDAPTYFNLGMEATKGDRDREAAEAFEHAVKVQPEFPEAHLRLGMSYDVLAKHVEAEVEYKLAVEQYRKKVAGEGKDAADWFNLGLTYSQLKRHDEAVGAFRQATRLKDDYADAYFELGDSLIRIARYPEAISVLKKAIELDPDNYQAKDALEKAQEGQQRIDSEVKQQQAAGKNKNKNANTPGDGNANGGNSGGNSNRKPRPTPKP